MGNLLKFTLLLFVMLLSYDGSSEGSCGRVFPTRFQESAEEPVRSEVSTGKYDVVHSLYRSGEHLLNFGSSLPVPPLKYHPFGFLSGVRFLELRIQGIISHYLLNSKTIHRSLTIGDIIFPFHYFW